MTQWPQATQQNITTDRPRFTEPLCKMENTQDPTDMSSISTMPKKGHGGGVLLDRDNFVLGLPPTSKDLFSYVFLFSTRVF